jgi:hypothetical protein
MAVSQRNTSMSATEQRMRQIEKEFGDLAMNKCKDLSQKQVTQQCKKLIDEHHALEQKLKALPYASSADSADFNRAHGGMQLKAASGVKSRNVSPLDIPGEELANMFEAAKRKMPYRTQITTKAFNVGGGAGAPPAGTKTTATPIVEGAPWPSGLFPPVLQADLSQDLRFEPDRFADHLPTLEIEAPSVEYLVHTGNTNPAAVVEELGVKPDLGMQLDTQTAVPVKTAALASVSMEALADFDYFSSWVPRELSRAIINKETGSLVMGAGSPDMTGFVATSGVLSRAYNAQHDISGLDTLIQATNDIRVGPAFGEADLIALHPTTWNWLKRTKTTTEAFVLAPMEPGTIGALDNLFGTKVIVNTEIPEGTSIVLDTQLAARYFVRQGLSIDMNPYGDTQWTTNQISFRAEMRSTLAVLRPTAVCIVTGLYPYSGS